MTYLDDKILTDALKICERVYKENNQGERMSVSSFYKSSSNITPDLSFGLFGALYLKDDKHMKLFIQQAERIKEAQDKDGRIMPRVAVNDIL